MGDGVSRGRPDQFNPKSGAWGIGQWLGARGHGKTTDYDAQLGKDIGELNGPEGKAAARLRDAKTAREAAVGASMFKRAEHYNPRTGTDDWTAKSEAGHARISGILAGTEQPGDHPADASGAGISSSKAVDSARSAIAMNDSAAAQSLHHYMHSGQWCADFVNGTLAKTGARGPATHRRLCFIAGASRSTPARPSRATSWCRPTTSALPKARRRCTMVVCWSR